MTKYTMRWPMRSCFLFLLAITAIGLSGAQGQTPQKSPARAADDEESGESILAREKFIYTRRAGGPGKTIPEGAYEQAVAQHLAMMKQRGPSGITGALPSWKSVNPSGLFYVVTNANYISGRTNSITWDPSDPTTIYIGAAGGGVWKSTDNGTGWQALTDNLTSLATGAVTADPLDPNILYLGTGELNYSLDSYYGDGLFKSTDAGASWVKIFDTYLGRRFSQIVVNPVNDSIVYTASNQNVFKSTDMGAGWSNTVCGSYVNSLVIDPINPQILYAAIGGTGANSLRKTTNGGATWSTLAGGLPTTSMGRTSLAISQTNPSVVYASIAHKLNNQLVGLYRTTNGGTSWTLQASSPNYLGGQGWYANSVAVSPYDENTVAVGGLDVYVSIDGGVTLNQKSLWYSGSSTNFTHADIHFLGYNGGTLYCGSDGGVYRSTDEGNSWKDLNSGLSTLQFQSADYDPSDTLKIVGGTQDNNIERTDDGGTSWSQYTTGDGGYTVIDPVTPSVVYGQYVNGSVERSDNGGFGFLEISPNGASGGLFYNPYELAPGNHDVIVYAQSDVWKTLSAGTASTTSGWSQISGNVGGNVSAIGISATDINKIYLGTDNGKILMTTNNGAAWTTTLAGSIYVTDLAVDPANDSVCYATFGGFGPSTHVFRTTNRGATWGNITSNLPNIPVNTIVLRSVLPRMLIIGTDLGVYRSTNEGAGWSSFNSGLPTLAVFDLKYKDANKLLLAATHGRGCFTYDLSGFAFGASPAAIPFGNVLIYTSKLDSVTVTNTGSTTLTVTSVSSDNPEFTVSPASGAIAPSASVKFYVTYHPGSVGGLSATLTFTHSGITSPDQVTVTGFGSTPVYSANPTSLNFGTLLLGLSKQDSITVSNPGSFTLQIDTVVSTNADFTVSPLSGTIVAGGNRKFYVTYYATATGTSAGSLIFSHNALTTPDSVVVTGTGGVATVQMVGLQDADGDLGTTGDLTSKKWYFSVYQNTISPGTFVGSGDSSRATIFLPSAGTYILTEADSGLPWSRINLNKQRYDTISIVGGATVIDTFINRKFTTSISTADKWNMLSLPLIVNDSSYTTLFPDAIAGPFKYVSIYQFNPYLSKGIGYWLKFSGTRSYSYSGKPVDSLTINTRLGWNLIGTVASPVLTANILQSPPRIVYTPYFRYKGNYSIVDTLFPGNAYWVKTSQVGQLLISPGNSAEPAAAMKSPGLITNRLSKLTVEDAGGGAQQSLYIYARSHEENISYEMPPRAPEGMPDVRFSSNRIVEAYDRRSDNTYPMSISAMEFPITFRWDPDEDINRPLQLSWTIDGRHREGYLDSHAPLVVSDTAATGFVLEIKSELPLPSVFALEQNYPNPFNPSSVIRYSLPVNSYVLITVYNILGQEVRTLINEFQTAGYKSVTLDAGNMPSGVYMYKLQSGSFSETKKMLLLK